MTVISYSKNPALRFNNSLNGKHSAFSSLYGEERAASVPVNIREMENAYEIELIAPGLAKEDFSISIDQNILTVRGSKAAEAKQNEKIILREYNFRNFSRSFTLSENIDAERISAKYVNGVLTLDVGRKDAVKPPKKEITIS